MHMGALNVFMYTVVVVYYINPVYGTNDSASCLQCPIVLDCMTWSQFGANTSGVYLVSPDGKTPFQVRILNMVSIVNMIFL